MLDTFSAPGRFWRGNLHAHSSQSDGLLAPDDVCTRYRLAGYDFISVTDHFLPAYGYPLTDTRPYRAKGFTTLLGAEMHAPRTSRDEQWHLLAIGLPEGFPATGPAETGIELARRCKEAGAFVAIAHPHWYQLRLEDALTIDAAHAVEVYNHTGAINCDRGDGLVMYDALLSEGRRLSAIAVDDGHWMTPDFFGGWVMVKAEADGPEQLLEALKAGRFYASQGPEIHDVRLTGDTLEISCSPAETVILVGPVSMNSREHGRGLRHASFSVEKYRGAWCRAVVVDATGKTRLEQSALA